MSLHLSKKGDYGLLLVTVLAGRTGFASLRQIAWEKKLPYKFLSQVAGELHKAGILESKEGVRGGYRLTKSPKKVLVREILDVLEGPMEASECEREHECDCGDSCVHERVEEKLAVGANRALAMFTVADLVKDAED